MFTCRDSNVDGNNEIVKLLLEYGADTNLRNNRGQCSLVITCAHPDSNIEIVKLLLEYKAKVDNPRLLKMLYNKSTIDVCTFIIPLLMDNNL